MSGFWDKLNSGGIYDPATDTWEPISELNAPSARDSDIAFWIGSKMLIWSGFTGNASYLNTGGLYDPGLDKWQPTATNNSPAPRSIPAAVFKSPHAPFNSGWAKAVESSLIVSFNCRKLGSWTQCCLRCHPSKHMM